MKITTEQEHETALARVERLLDLRETCDELEELVDAIVEYEDRVYPIPPPPFLAKCEYHLGRLGWKRFLAEWLPSEVKGGAGWLVAKIRAMCRGLPGVR